MWMVEGDAGNEVPWGRARPQSPDILGIVRDWISPGPSQGLSEETEAQTGQWSCEWLRQSQTPCSILVPSSPPSTAQGPPPGDPSWDQSHPGSLGPKDNVKYQLWTKGNKNLFLEKKKNVDTNE